MTSNIGVSDVYKYPSQPYYYSDTETNSDTESDIFNPVDLKDIEQYKPANVNKLSDFLGNLLGKFQPKINISSVKVDLSFLVPYLIIGLIIFFLMKAK